MNKISKNIIQFTRELIAIPSQNGIDSEITIAKTVFNKLKSFGFKPEIIGAENHHPLFAISKRKILAKQFGLRVA